MTDPRPPEPPSSFVVEWAGALAPRGPEPRRALDVGMGRGRHALMLAERGFSVFGVDVCFDALQHAARTAVAANRPLRLWCADLTNYPLPVARFELVVVTRYLQRDLFPALGASLVPGGVILYETFTEAQRALGRGPRSPDHLLQVGELKERFAGFDVLFYEEVVAPEAVARLAARLPVRGTL